MVEGSLSCRVCGTDLPTEAGFCWRCGAPVVAVPAGPVLILAEPAKVASNSTGRFHSTRTMALLKWGGLVSAIGAAAVGSLILREYTIRVGIDGRAFFHDLFEVGVAGRGLLFLLSAAGICMIFERRHWYSPSRLLGGLLVMVVTVLYIIATISILNAELLVRPIEATSFLAKHDTLVISLVSSVYFAAPAWIGIVGLVLLLTSDLNKSASRKLIAIILGSFYFFPLTFGVYKSIAAGWFNSTSHVYLLAAGVDILYLVGVGGFSVAWGRYMDGWRAETFARMGAAQRALSWLLAIPGLVVSVVCWPILVVVASQSRPASIHVQAGDIPLRPNSEND